MKALVTGGYFDQGGDGAIWLVDFESERVDEFLRWNPPDHLRVPSKGFAGASISDDGQMYIAAHAAIVRVDLARAKVTGEMHQPCMNDLHHVAIIDDLLYVANTGLSSVDVFSRNGDFRASHALLPAWANARRFYGEDYPPNHPPVKLDWFASTPDVWPPIQEDDEYYDADRKSAPFHKLKIRDYLHINHISQLGDRILATCLDGAIRDIRDFSTVVTIEDDNIHDGVVFGEGFWLTTIKGSVVELDCETFAERRRLDVSSTGHYGWCRGLAVTGNHLLVGLTRMVDKPHRPWLNVGIEESETSVLLLDNRDARLLSHVDLSDATRSSKIYSILPIKGL